LDIAIYAVAAVSKMLMCAIGKKFLIIQNIESAKCNGNCIMMNEVLQVATFLLILICCKAAALVFSCCISYLTRQTVVRKEFLLLPK
jgi:hypothetical protein